MKTAASLPLVPADRRATAQVAVTYFDNTNTLKAGRIPFSDFEGGEPPDLSGYVRTVNGVGPDAEGNVTVAGGGGAQTTYWLGVTADFTPSAPNAFEVAASVTLPAGIYAVQTSYRIGSDSDADTYIFITGQATAPDVLIYPSLLTDGGFNLGFYSYFAEGDTSAGLAGTTVAGGPGVISNPVNQDVELRFERTGNGSLAAGSGFLFTRLADLPD